MEIFLLHLGILVIVITFLAFLGKALIKIFKINSSSNYLFNFYNILVGAVTFTLSTAIYYTQFKTVNSILLLGLITVLVLYKSNVNLLKGKVIKPQSFSSENKKFFYIDILVLVFLYILSFIKGYNFSEGVISSNDGDTNFYSHVSQFIAFSGQENAFNGLNVVDSSYHGVLPYHYFDLWLNAGIANLLGLINYNVLILVSYPLLQLVTFKGLTQLILTVATVKEIIVRFWAVQLFALFLIFLSGLNYYEIFHYKPLEAFVAFAENVFLRPKVIIVYLGLIAFLDFTLRKKYFFALLFVCLIPLFYFPTAPAIMGGLGAIILLLFLFKKNVLFNILSKAELLIVVFFYLGINLLLGSFLILSKPINSDIYSNITFFELIAKKDTYYILRSLFPLIKGYIFIVLVYLPFVFFLILYTLINKASFINTARKAVNSTNIFILAFYIFVTLAGSVIWAFMYYSIDSWQLFHNCAVAFSNLIVCLILINLFLSYNSEYKFKNVVLACISLYLFFSFLFTFKEYLYEPSDLIAETVYLEKIDKEFNNIEANTGGPIVGISLYPNSKFKHIYDYNLLVDRSGAYIRNIRNNVGFISMNVLDSVYSNSSEDKLGGIALQGELYKKIYRTAPLLFYMQKNRYKDLTDARIDFIKKNKIAFIISKANFSIPFLEKLNVRKKIIDAKSNDVIYFLNI